MDSEDNWEGDLQESCELNGFEEDREDDLGEYHQQLLDNWDRTRRMAVIQLVCYIVHALFLTGVMWNIHYVDRSLPNRGENESVRQKLLRQLTSNSVTCRDILRMGSHSFAKLCELLRGTGRLHDSKNALVEEQVAIFLHLISHNVKNRVLQLYFRRSGETISRHFHDVLRAIISLEDQFLKQPTGSDVPPQILHNSRFYPYFKDCVGAIDGTHIRVKVSPLDAPRYRGRKNYPTQNVLAACSFDLRFTYVLPGWEGTASDSRILKNALTRSDKLLIPTGKYYLVDGGYMLKSGLITPYRGVRYHLKEYSTRAPENAKEIFNHRHSSLRNVIERAFGVLKKRFPIIGSGAEAHYPVDTVTEIVLACTILHNYLMGVDPDEELIAEVDRELMSRSLHGEEACTRNNNDDDSRQGAIIRDNIAASMWEDYITNSFEMGKKAKTNDNAVETCSNIVKWTPEMDEVLLDALLDEQLKGHRPNGTFSTVAYNNVVKKLTDTLNCSLNKDHIKNRTKTLKQNFNTCYELFKGMSGFAWNSSTGLFEAEPDVWNELTKANSAAAKWRNTKICHYDKLLDLFAKDRATGEGAMSAKEKVQQWNIEGSSTLNDMNDGNESEYFMNLDPISPIDTSQANSQSAASSKNGKRKASMIEVMEKQVDVIDAGISNLTSAIKEGNAIAEKGNEIAEKRNEIAEKSRPRVYTEDEIFAGLIDIGVPDNLQLDAFLFLLKSEQKIRAFFGCPRERRGELLTKMMFGSNDS